MTKPNATHAALSATFRAATAALTAADDALDTEMQGYINADSLTPAEWRALPCQLEEKYNVIALTTAYTAARQALTAWTLDHFSEIPALEVLSEHRACPFAQEKIAAVSAAWNGQ